MLICHPLNLYCSSTDQSVTLPGRWCCSDRDCHKTCKQKQRKNQEDQRRKQKLLFCTRRLVTLDQFPSRSFSSVYISQCSSSVSASKGMITQATHYYIYQPLQFVFPLLFCASEFQLHFRLLYIWSVWLPPIHNDSHCLQRSCLLTPISSPFFWQTGDHPLGQVARRKKVTDGIMEFWGADVMVSTHS